ncbi:iron complex outermembrane receptor protein [Sediminitomix flava]|uniref:Iron complex outermembrane receptor protein n=2 Tax=Sediminitomix flava TaxID=379075 RepID=A0A315ZCL5_SEDFL|nr:iron complex outermembrane receptor protein [Sediminitomix flava]
MTKNLSLLAGIWVLSLLVPFMSFAQERTLTGTVLDETGTPLPGVSVIFVGTTTGAATNFDGQYKLNIPEDASQVKFSYIGYIEQVVELGAQSIIDVTLQPDADQLEEVVVIGYGSAKKDDLTGSVESIDTSKFNQGAISSPQDLLTGKIAGVNITNGGGAPGAGATIRIRGGSSLSASNDPLIVIDGVPVDSDGVAGMRNPLNTINPNDIETFTVLKDASATAIYGSRASNGVIIITTKKGTRDGIQVEYNGTVSVGTPTGQIDVLSADQYRDLMIKQYGEASPEVALLGSSNTDWQEELMRNAISTDQNISVAGRTGILPYRVSFGYNNSNGILETSNMERYTTSVNLNPKFFDDHLAVNVSAKYVNVSNRFADTGSLGSAIAYDPTQSVKGSGDQYDAFGGYYTWLDADYNPITIAPSNPVAMLNQTENTSTVNRFIGNLQFDYKFHFLPELKANLNLGYDHSASKGGTYNPITSAWNYNITDPTMGGSLSHYDQNKTNELLDFTLQYDKELGDHRFNVLGGYSWQHFHQEQDDWWTNARGDSQADNPNAGTYAFATEYYLVSFFGRANYTLKDKYMVTATVRSDGTSRFSENNRWGIFPSAAFAWNIGKEDFIQNSAVVSSMKLRAGWGITGQQNIGGGNYPYMPTYIYGDERSQYVYYDPNTGKMIYPTIRPNGYDENIKWEETTTYNIGLDFGFFDDKLTGNIDAYHRVTNDLLNTVPVASGSNLTNQLLTNVGSLQNQGVELTLNSKLVQTGDFFLDFGVNFTYNRTEITQLTLVDDPDYAGVKVGGIAGGTGQTIQIHQVGYAPSSFLVYEQIYDDKGMPIEGAYVDRNGDGQITEADKYIAGDPNPDFMIGVNMRATYKNWDFSMSGRANFGQQVYNNVNSANSNLNGMSVSGFNSNRTADVYNTMFQTMQQHSDYYVQDANYFRMDNIMLGYNFNNLAGGKYNARVYGTVNNAFVITGYDGLDPEVSGGIDNNLYPRPRTYMLGVNLSF